VRLTYVGGATMLLQIEELNLLLDPCFDPGGSEYRMMPGIEGSRLTDPALRVDELPALDAVLLTHDHRDHLDESGRQLALTAPQVLTTPTAANKLGGPATGLRTWTSWTLLGRSGTLVEVTSAPARHGPPGSEALVGTVTGFLLRWREQREGALYIGGDNMSLRHVAEVTERFPVAVAVLNLGAGGFRVTGNVRFSMNGADAARVAGTLPQALIVPNHYEGYSHFRENAAQARAALAEANLQDRLRWVARGETTELEI
jgi:L-ascorbate metabolism protein UlaG (beta-lactamase superfamily)